MRPLNLKKFQKYSKLIIVAAMISLSALNLLGITRLSWFIIFSLPLLPLVIGLLLLSLWFIIAYSQIKITKWKKRNN